MSANKPYTSAYYTEMFELGKTESERREAERKKQAARAAQKAKDLSDLRHTADAVLLAMCGGPIPGESGLEDEDLEAIYVKSQKKMVDNSRELSERERARLEKQVAQAMGIWEDDQC